MKKKLSFDNLGKLPFTKEACAEALKSMREFKVRDGILIGYKTEEGEYQHEHLSCRQRYGKSL